MTILTVPMAQGVCSWSYNECERVFDLLREVTQGFPQDKTCYTIFRVQYKTKTLVYELLKASRFSSRVLNQKVHSSRSHKMQSTMEGCLQCGGKVNGKIEEEMV